jgi:RimJ/RimL family protein N-acetyltransferase/GNAT superfamily N-acetyltransferase
VIRAHANGYEIDDDPGRVDAGAAVEFLTTQAYWGRHRGGDEIRRQISSAWRVIGAYDSTGAMVGFARAFSDGASAYLADVYVLPAHRGVGLGKDIVRAMIDDGPGAGFRWMLHTADAHGLYRQFGFAASYDGRYLERPGRWNGQTSGNAWHRRATRVTKPLTGQHVRLEPLNHRHVPGLVAAAQGGAELYRWARVPQGEEAVRRYVESALAERDRGEAVPFAVTSTAEDRVIGSTRFSDFGYWAWPDSSPDAARFPDTCEIGGTWLSMNAIRTGANTDMKRLMLAHAFETWGARSVCLHTDARNQRSRAAIERLGARFEGILRAHRLGADGAPRDSARYSITAAEWPEIQHHLGSLLHRYQETA